MGHPRFLHRAREFARQAVDTYKEAALENHPGLIGVAREAAAEILFSRWLPPVLGLGTGKIVDSDGGESLQTDLILYRKDILPPLLYEGRFGLFPVESELYAIEVKSTASNSAARATVAAGQRIAALKTQSGMPPNLAYLSFSTDLVAPAPSSELDRFRDAARGGSDPRLQAICVVGGGYWGYDEREGWMRCAPTGDYDELVTFATSVLNTSLAMMNRGERLGRYVWSAADRLEKM